ADSADAATRASERPAGAGASWLRPPLLFTSRFSLQRLAARGRLLSQGSPAGAVAAAGHPPVRRARCAGQSGSRPLPWWRFGPARGVLAARRRNGLPVTVTGLDSVGGRARFGVC